MPNNMCCPLVLSRHSCATCSFTLPSIGTSSPCFCLCQNVPHGWQGSLSSLALLTLLLCLWSMAVCPLSCGGSVLTGSCPQCCYSMMLLAPWLKMCLGHVSTVANRRRLLPCCVWQDPSVLDMICGLQSWGQGAWECSWGRCYGRFY